MSFVRVTKYGHSCLLVEEGEARLLTDPGTFSRGFDELSELSAVLVTHQHADHVDQDRLEQLVGHNPDALLLADEQTAGQLAERGMAARAVQPGDEISVAGTTLQILGGQHAVIHPDIPRIANVGYLIAGRLLHPGDSLIVPDDAEVDVLAIPLVAPWMRLSETVDYLRAVAPRLSIPIHDAITAAPQIYLDNLGNLAPEATSLQVLEPGKALEL